MSALLQLLRRPMTFWYVALIGFTLFGVHALGDALRGVAAREEDARAATALVLVPFGAGAVLAWSCFELLVCPWSRFLPRLRTRLATGLSVFALLAAAGAAVFGAFRPELPGALGSGAFAFLGFGLGVLATDPQSASRKPVGALLFLAFFAGVLAAPELVRAAIGAGVLFVPLALCAGAAALLLPFGDRRSRARALRSPEEFLGGLENPDLRLGSLANWKPGDGEGAPLPGGGRPLRSTADHVRATLFELHGGRHGAVAALVIAPLIELAIVLATVAAVFALRTGTEQPSFAEWLLAALAGERARQSGIILACWSGMCLMVQPSVPLARPGRPVSRERLGAIVWRVATLQSLLRLGVVVAALSLLLVALASFTGAPGGGDVPAFLVAAAVITCCAPAAQWLRLRFIDSLPQPPGPLRVGLLIGAVLAVLVLGVVLLGERDVERFLDTWPTGALPAAWLLLFLAAQCAWRAAARRHFRRCDLW